MDNTDNNYTRSYKNVIYFPIRQKNKNGFSKVFYRLKHGVENKHLLDNCLNKIESFKPDSINILGTELFYVG